MNQSWIEENKIPPNPLRKWSECPQMEGIERINGHGSTTSFFCSVNLFLTIRKSLGVRKLFLGIFSPCQCILFCGKKLGMFNPLYIQCQPRHPDLTPYFLPLPMGPLSPKTSALAEHVVGVFAAAGIDGAGAKWRKLNNQNLVKRGDGLAIFALSCSFFVIPV